MKHSNGQQVKFLQESVQNTPDLESIKKTAKLLALHSGKRVTLDQCVTLLDEAAMECDVEVGKVSSHVWCWPCSTYQTHTHDVHGLSSSHCDPFAVSHDDFSSVHSTDFHHPFEDISPLVLDASI